MAMTATLNSASYTSAASAAQPVSSAGLVVRTAIINLAAGDANGNYSGNNSTGLGTIYAATGTPIGSGTITLRVANTASSTGTLYPITSGVTFVPSHTAGCQFSTVVISSS